MSGLKFSANLGFLWKELTLPDAIRAAALAGFDAVECHWPYQEDEQAVQQALLETGLPILSINTSCGVADTAFGFAALEGHEKQARNAIDEALDWAARFDVPNVHVMAGTTSGRAARETLTRNLEYACQQATHDKITVLIEPLNPHDAFGYFYSTTAEAMSVIGGVDAENLKLMFDCYHVGRTEAHSSEAIVDRLHELLPHVGHIQFAAVPDRGTPDHGEVDIPQLFKAIADLGWDKPLGAEYRVVSKTEDTLGWFNRLRAR